MIVRYIIKLLSCHGLVKHLYRHIQWLYGDRVYEVTNEQWKLILDKSENIK